MRDDIILVEAADGLRTRRWPCDPDDASAIADWRRREPEGFGETACEGRGIARWDGCIAADVA